MSFHDNVKRTYAALLAAVLLLVGMAGCRQGNVDSGTITLSFSDAAVEITGGEDIALSAKERISEDGIEYAVTESGAIVLGPAAKAEGELAIPAKAGGTSVTAVADDAFSDEKYITSVSLPESVVAIGENAFAGCARLTAINLGSVERIGSNAFSGCVTLAEADIGSAVDIGDAAFERCFKLDGVKIPASLESLGDGAFSDCASLKSFSVAKKNKVLSYSEPLLTSADGSEVYMCLPTVKGKFDIPEGVTLLRPRSFEDCTALTSVKLPSTLTEIGDRAFGNCYAMKCGALPESLKRIGTEAFDNCDAITSLTLPDSLTTLGARTFFDCDNLKKIKIGASLTELGDGAFAGCVVLKEVTVSGKNPSFVMSEGVLYTTDRKTVVAAFKLKDINPKTGAYETPPGVERIAPYAYYDRGDIVELTVSPGVKEIGERAFSWCTKIYSVSLPKSLETIGRSAFEYATSYDRLGSPPALVIPDNVTSIGERAFARCYKLKEVKLGKGIEKIPDEAFLMCSKLTSITIGSAESIGRDAFSGDLVLKSVTLPKGLKLIDRGAFRDCVSLGSISLPNSLEEIRADAFYSCGLDSIALGSHVTTVEPFAFARNNRLAGISAADGNAALCVQDGMLLSADLSTLLLAPCAKTGDITVPDGVTKIAAGAFADSAAKTVRIPSSVDEIEDGAFRDCGETLVISAAAGSRAAAYAEENGIRFMIAG